MILFRGRWEHVVTFYVMALLITLLTAQWSYAEDVRAVEDAGPSFALELFFYILIFTAAFLVLSILIKELIRVLIFVLELFFLFFTSLLFFGIVLGDFGGIVWASFLTLARALLRENRFIRNFSVALIAGTSAGVLGAALSPATVLLLYAILILYDFVSVFLTGHMLKLVESVEGKHKSGGGEVGLGGGDLVVPALLSASLLNVDILPALASLVGALLGTLLALYCLKRFRVPLPALPYIGAVQLSLTALSLSLSILPL